MLVNLSANNIIISQAKSDLLQAPVSKQVDTRGMACPYPSFEAVKALTGSPFSGCLEIITDSDESALKSIPNVCRKRNWEFVVIEESPNLRKIRIKK
jgi:TusA-related sulfurtransferase